MIASELVADIHRFEVETGRPPDAVTLIPRDYDALQCELEELITRIAGPGPAAYPERQCFVFYGTTIRRGGP